jgi:hypothetical protein
VRLGCGFGDFWSPDLIQLEKGGASSEISWKITWLLTSILTDLASLASNSIPGALKAEIAALLADPFRAALASGEADTKPAMHDWVPVHVCGCVFHTMWVSVGPRVFDVRLLFAQASVWLPLRGWLSAHNFLPSSFHQVCLQPSFE